MPSVSVELVILKRKRVRESFCWTESKVRCPVSESSAAGADTTRDVSVSITLIRRMCWSRFGSVSDILSMPIFICESSGR